MLETVLSATDGPVVATLHPHERYDPPSLQALDRLQARFSRLRIQTGGSDALLPECAFVVTQNSSIALKGFFLEKPCVLFARIDFHHIAAKAEDLGGAEAVRAVTDLRPDFAAYLWWFFRDHALDVSRPNSVSEMGAALRRIGWPVGAS